jgi:hypothetical protein
MDTPGGALESKWQEAKRMTDESDGDGYGYGYGGSGKVEVSGEFASNRFGLRLPFRLGKDRHVTPDPHSGANSYTAAPQLCSALTPLNHGWAEKFWSTADGIEVAVVA